MWICILAPVLGVTFLILNSQGFSFGKYLPYAVFMLCPLSHIAMMGLMHKKPKPEAVVGEKADASDCH